MLSRYFNQDKIIVFPESRYKFVREPIGTVFRESEIDKLVEYVRDVWFRGGFVASVGDRVTSTMLELGLIPDIAVIDLKEKRRRVSLVDRSLFNKVFYGSNPRGRINLGLYRLIVEALRHHPSIIIIDGEEDLVGFPAVLALPNGSAFIYGLPGVGLSFVNIDPDIKFRALNLIRDLL